VKEGVSTGWAVLMAGVGVGMVLGWIVGREWLQRSEPASADGPEPLANRLSARLLGCTEVERN
jgi:hypothetical protein